MIIERTSANVRALWLMLGQIWPAACIVRGRRRWNGDPNVLLQYTMLPLHSTHLTLHCNCTADLFWILHFLALGCSQIFVLVNFISVLNCTGVHWATFCAGSDSGRATFGRRENVRGCGEIIRGETLLQCSRAHSGALYCILMWDGGRSRGHGNDLLSRSLSTVPAHFINPSIIITIVSIVGIIITIVSMVRIITAAAIWRG